MLDVHSLYCDNVMY